MRKIYPWSIVHSANAVAGHVVRALPLQNSSLYIYPNAGFRARSYLRTGKLYLIIFLILLLVSEQAQACRSPKSQTTIFFDAVPVGIAAPVIAHVTITEIVRHPTYALPNNAAFSFIGIARIDRLIKGTIAGSAIRIEAPNSSCDKPFRVGSTGIVVGNVEQGSDGTLKLRPRTRYLAPELQNELPEPNRYK